MYEITMQKKFLYLSHNTHSNMDNLQLNVSLNKLHVKMFYHHWNQRNIDVKAHTLFIKNQNIK